MLYDQSGLLGLSGISDDMRVLQDSPDPRAAAAIEKLHLRHREIRGRLCRALGGLDAVVFTAGIARIRRRCAPPSARALLRLVSGLMNRRMPRAGRASPRRQPGFGLGHPDQRGTDDRRARLGR